MMFVMFAFGKMIWNKKDPSLEIGSNNICLNNALKNYLSIGAVDIAKVKYVRRAFEDEIPE